MGRSGYLKQEYFFLGPIFFKYGFHLGYLLSAKMRVVLSHCSGQVKRYIEASVNYHSMYRIQHSRRYHAI